MFGSAPGPGPLQGPALRHSPQHPELPEGEEGGEEAGEDEEEEADGEEKEL